MMKSITSLLTCIIFVLGFAFQAHAQNRIEKEKTVTTGQQIELQIEGMACSLCEQNCKRSLEKLEGVKVEEISASKGIARVTYSGIEPVSDEELKKAVENAGYKLKKIEREDTNHSDDGAVQ